MSVSAFRFSRLARPALFRELSAPAIQSSRRARAFSSPSAFAMSTLTRSSPCRTGERCEKKPYGTESKQGEKAENSISRLWFFLKQAARARADEHARDRVRGLSDGERGLGEVAEGEEGEDRRVERDGEEERQEH